MQLIRASHAARDGTRQGQGARHAVLGGIVGIALIGWSMSILAQVKSASIEPLPGSPTLLLGAFDVDHLGYRVDEFVLSGTATSFRFVRPPRADGEWDVAPDKQAPYRTRVVVVRPQDPVRFNGIVLVEWLNVTAGQDTAADWMVTHREILRRGYAYVAVSAQQVGIEGGTAAMPGAPGGALKKTNPQRYGSLAHPGDAWSYDIYSQAGAALKRQQPGGLLGALVPKMVVSTA